MGKNAEAVDEKGAALSSGPTLAQRAVDLSGAGDGGFGRDDWDQGEVDVCLAMVRAALRLKSAPRLAAAIEAFGGLPPEGGKWLAGKPLSDAAMAPDAFGFEVLLGAQQKAAAGSKTGWISDRQERLGEWLRTGLFNSFYGGSGGFDARSASEVGSRVKPVAACLAHDNPVALALILEDTERRAALALWEPAPMSDPPDWTKMSSYSDGDATLKAGRSAEAGFEKSLLWQAISMKAFRCAALLCALPEFNKPLLRSEGFGALSEQRHWFQRGANGSFEEKGAVPFCFFEWAASMGNEVERSSRREGAKVAWMKMLGAMSDAGDEACRQHRQAGTGMGWPEMFFVRAEPHRWGARAELSNEFAQAEVAAAMAMLDRFESNGFAPQWEALAHACAERGTLKDWLDIKGASSPSPKGERRARRVSL